jgi:AcrR family transcriptional regulator
MAKENAKRRRPSARVALKREQTRRDILDAAQAILSDGGVEAITLASVAGRLGMTKQALYHYFSSKEALVRGLVTTLLDDEIETLIAAIEHTNNRATILGTLISAFHQHYADKLDAFRTVYCQSQIYSSPDSAIDELTLRDEIHPRTRHLFDVLEESLAGARTKAIERRYMRQLAFTAWTSALGLVTMLGVADATNDPLMHTDKDLVNTLSKVFNDAAANTADE